MGKNVSNAENQTREEPEVYAEEHHVEVGSHFEVCFPELLQFFNLLFLFSNIIIPYFWENVNW